MSSAPPPVTNKAPIVPQHPVVSQTGLPGAFMVELLIFNGAPFKDHWAYWVRSLTDRDIGVEIHATG
ncbi:hypothetical protein EYZ11_004557 [Aspergillus tanneri]|uniref:Uncharacterized protein n=1 Tax=Aspergillus tanneri TaxID=1220188 RepID=A0A4S3JKT4_9EURO|nr:hypothetical protein EYZ11_004557 [Aspergillus tanneri]